MPFPILAQGGVFNYVVATVNKCLRSQFVQCAVRINHGKERLVFLLRCDSSICEISVVSMQCQCTLVFSTLKSFQGVDRE